MGLSYGSAFNLAYLRFIPRRPLPLTFPTSPTSVIFAGGRPFLVRVTPRAWAVYKHVDWTNWGRLVWTNTIRVDFGLCRVPFAPDPQVDWIHTSNPHLLPLYTDPQVDWGVPSRDR